MFSDDKPYPMIILYNKHVDTILIKIFENCNYYEEISLSLLFIHKN